VHLDHGSGSAALLEACPNATLLAHPKAARHLIRPERLIQSAMEVYGEEAFHRLYGEIHPVPKDRVHRLADNEVIDWGTRKLTFLHTLGHASHHICMHDSRTNSVFTGDAFGVGRSEWTRPGPAFCLATTSPTDFDPHEARRTVQRLRDTGADWAFPTHYGPIQGLEASGDQLLRSIDFSEEILNDAFTQGLEDEALFAFCEAKMRDAVGEHVTWCGVEDPGADLDWLKFDIPMNAKGIAFAVQQRKRREGKL
jgi:glyoxylase-like metal-dependent hydrolase (beta-lactamase superfamily II)